MKKNQKKLLSFSLLFVLAFASVGFYFYQTKKNNNDLTLSSKEPNPGLKKISSNQNKRDIASIKPSIMLPKRVRVGIAENDTTTPIINKVSTDWEDKYKERFFQNPGAEEIKDFKITHKRSLIRKKHNLAQNLEHIHVSYKLASGYPFNFEAYIDSETGILVHSFNQTHYEFDYRKKIGFDINGNFKVQN